MEERYTIEEFAREISVEEYLDQFHNPAEVWGYCRACSNYGKQWGCPPFDFDVVEHKWRTPRIYRSRLRSILQRKELVVKNMGIESDTHIFLSEQCSTLL